MDLAKTLIRSVARAFYETKHVLVVDALLVHSALRDDDLAHLLGMQTKELRKLCAKLDEHRLLAVHNRQEIREGMQRPISKTYYYIDFRQTIDAIKYRIYRITKEVEALIRPTDERKDYFCPRCGSRWTQMEVLDNRGANGFNCHKCGSALDRDEENVGEGGGHELQSKLMKQLEPLLILLPRIDEVVIPDNNFETAFNSAVPVQRNQQTNPSAPTVPVAMTAGQVPTAVKGVTQLAPPRIEVDLTSSEAKSAAEQAAEAERKARVAEQNALPVWHTNSTVTGEKTALGSKEEAARWEREHMGGVRAEENEEKKLGTESEMTDEVAQYYAQLARDQQKAKEEEDESSSGEEDDDDDDDNDENNEDEEVFEDVPASSSSLSSAALGFHKGSTHVPPAAAAAAAAINGASPMRRAGSTESSSSFPTTTSTPVVVAAATATTATTAPVNNDQDDNDDDDGARAPAKRPRLDQEDAATTTTTTKKPNGNHENATGPLPPPSLPPSTHPPPTQKNTDHDHDEDDDDEEEEVEFEDV